MPLRASDRRVRDGRFGRSFRETMAFPAKLSDCRSGSKCSPAMLSSPAATRESLGPDRDNQVAQRIQAPDA